MKILTAYFNTRKDPQRGYHWDESSYKLIAPLYESVRRLKVEMVIFHDNIHGNFINKHKTDRIIFYRYEPQEDLLNARWRCFYEHIKKNDGDYLCMDISDTEIFRDPTPLIDDKIIIGSEEAVIGEMAWIHKWFERAYNKIYYPKEQVLNPGILGGRGKDLLRVLTRYLTELDNMLRQDAVDMAIFNKIMRDFDYKTGYPIHTRFAKYEKDKSCYLRHK